MESKNNWRWAEPIHVIIHAVKEGKGVRIGINKEDREFAVWTPLLGVKIIKFDPNAGGVVLEGAEEEFMNTPTFSEPMSLEELKEMITNNKIEA